MKSKLLYFILGYYFLSLLGSFGGSYLHKEQLSNNLTEAFLVSIFVGTLSIVSYKLSKTKKDLLKVLTLILAPIGWGVLLFISTRLLFHTLSISMWSIVGAWCGLFIFFGINVWWKYEQKYSPSKSVTYSIVRDYFKSANLDKAIEECKKILSKDPDPKLGYCWLGYLLHKKELYNEAISYYQKALEIDPEDHRVLYNCGLAHYKAGDYEKSKLYWDRGGYKYQEELDKLNAKPPPAAGPPGKD